MNAPTFVHTFTAAGLGPAPFVFTGYEKAVYQACHGAPTQPGSSCDRCGSGIMHVFRIQAADGTKSKVGIDCIQHLNDNALLAAARQGQRAYERSVRDAAYREERETRKRDRLLQLAELGARYTEECAMLVDGCTVIMASTNASDFEKKLAECVYEEITGGARCGVSEKEWNRLAPAYLAASEPGSRHIGTAPSGSAKGERLRDLKARYEGGPWVGIDSIFGPTLLARFRVIDGEHRGAVLIWKSKHNPWVGDDKGHLVQVGEEVVLAGTVVKHDAYQGVKQTFVNRCKCK